MAESLEDKLNKIDRLEQEMLRKLAAAIPSGSDMYVSHMFIFGAAKRTLALGEGFRMLVRASNFPCAAPIVRMQIDTALRLFAGTLVENSETFASAVLGGEPIDKMRDRRGRQLRDGYLVKLLSERYPWIPNVYKETSGLVHFSSRHIFAGAHSLNEKTRTVNFLTGAKDPPRPEEDYFEMVDCFFEATKMTGTLAWSWALQRQQAA